MVYPHRLGRACEHFTDGKGGQLFAIFSKVFLEWTLTKLDFIDMFAVLVAPNRVTRMQSLYPRHNTILEIWIEVSYNKSTINPDFLFQNTQKIELDSKS